MRGRIKAEYTITLSGDCILIGCTGIVDGNCDMIGYSDMRVKTVVRLVTELFFGFWV